MSKGYHVECVKLACHRVSLALSEIVLSKIIKRGRSILEGPKTLGLDSSAEYDDKAWRCERRGSATV